MIFVLLIFLLTDMLSVGSCNESKIQCLPNVTDYFPQLKFDLTKLSWAHAVNDLALLKSALEDENIMMLEADVVLGVLEGQNEVIPIMAHPPKNTSNLSLEMFIKAVINEQKNKKKGIKLDFKSTESFEASWKIIDQIKSEMHFPVFLNADIVPGPVNSTVKPVNADVFLKLSSSKLPESLLSIGWTTYYAPGIEGSYTEDQLSHMKAVLKNNKVLQPVTLCVRAGIAAKSPGIINLVNEINEFQKSNTTSITIWMSTDSDPVDVPKLRNLIFALNKSRVFLDVPEFLKVQLGLHQEVTKTAITAIQEALITLLTSVTSVFSNVFLM